MQYFHTAAFLSLISAAFCWDCPPNQKQSLNGSSFPLAGSFSYSPNLRCIFEIVVPQGQFISLIVDSSIAKGDSLLFKDDTNLYIPYNQGHLELATPRTITISLNSSATTNGSLALIWYFSKLPYDTKIPMRDTVAPSRVGVILQTEIVFISPYVITSNNSIVLAVAANPIDPTSYKLTSTFVFAGEGVSGKYLGSLYSMLNTGYFRCETNTITVVSVSNMAAGIALAKTYEDVKGFNYRIAYADAVGDSIILDGRTKPQAITLFSLNAENVYMSSPNFSTTLGSLEWQSEDLRPNSVILTSYQVDDSRLKSLPQAMPGYMKTLSTRNAHVTIPISLMRPAVYNNVTVGSSGIFTSRNFGASKMVQKNSISFKSDQRLKLAFNALEVYNNTVFFLKVVDGNQTTTKNVMARETYSVIGSQFEFSYNISWDFRTSGGLSTFQFAALNHSSYFDVSLLITAIIIFLS